MKEGRRKKWSKERKKISIEKRKKKRIRKGGGNGQMEDRKMRSRK
jgi:hypothetical protein